MSYLSDLLGRFSGQKKKPTLRQLTSGSAGSFTPSSGTSGMRSTTGQTLGDFLGGAPKVAPNTVSAAGAAKATGTSTGQILGQLPKVAPNTVTATGAASAAGVPVSQILSPLPAVTTTPSVASAGAVSSPYVSSLADINRRLGTSFSGIRQSYVPGSSVPMDASGNALVAPDLSMVPKGATNPTGSAGKAPVAFGTGAASRAEQIYNQQQSRTGGATQGYTPGAPLAPVTSETAGVPTYDAASFVGETETGGRAPTGRVEQRTSDGRYKVDGVWYLPNGMAIGSRSGGDDPFARALVSEQKQYDVTRNDVLQQMQREIDATREIYAERVKAAEREGESRVGSTRAIQARGGLLGSDFAGAQTDAVNEYNRGQVGAIQSELAARISQITGDATARQVALAEEKTAALRSGAQAYMDYLTKADERKEAELRRIAGNVIAQGMDVDQIDGKTLDTIAKSIGATAADVRRAYQQVTAENAAASQESTPGGFELSAGQVRYEYDPETGGYRQVAVGPEKTGGLSDPQKVSTFNQIVNSMNRSPLVLAADRTPVLKKSIEDINANPEDAATQLNLSYAYIQALDTYQSAVREGELGNLNSIDSKVGSLSNSVSQIQNGQIVRPEVAKQIAAAAKSIVDTIEAAAAQKVNSFRSQANVSGVGQEFEQYLGGFDAAYSNAGPNEDALIESYLRQNPQATDEELLRYLDSQTSFNPAGNASASTADALANAIMQVESGGRQVAGASGEFGAFQFLPSTWETVSREVAGSVLPQTPENEFAVARAKIGQLLATGYSPRDVAAIWNTSLGGSEEPRYIRGVNDQGVAYDSIAYADKVMSALGNIS